MLEALGQLVRRRPLMSFYGLALAFPIALFTYMVVFELVAGGPQWRGGGPVAHFYATQADVIAAHPLLAHHRDSVVVSLLSYAAAPFAAPFLFFPFAPTAAALIVVWLGWGGAGIKALVGAFRPVRGAITWREGVRLYLVLLALIAATLSVAGVVISLSDDPEGLATYTRTFGLFDARYLLTTLAMALLLNQGALLEELGWRGYALPLLLRRHASPLIAALILGVLWALWHLPREIPSLLQGQQTFSQLALGQAVFIVSCCASTIVMVLFVNLTGGSVLPAILLHGTLNLLFSAYQTAQSQIRGDLVSPSVLAWVIAAVLCLLTFGRDLGLRQRNAAHGGDGSSDPSRIWADRTKP